MQPNLHSAENKKGGCAKVERIGIMGGTLDPIHQGHLLMAKEALQDAQLDRVLILPTGNPPHKSGVTDGEHRWRMVCAATAWDEGLEPCRIELDRGGVIYTIDTLSQLKGMYPDAELFYIIGADTLLDLKNWRRYTEVLQLCTFLVCPRPWDTTPAELAAEEARLTALGGRFMHIGMPLADVSSTEVRQALAKGEAPEGLPLPVTEYARLAGLYGRGTSIPAAWLDRLFSELKITRFTHSLGVVECARRLADKHGIDTEKAVVAALLHDCAKYVPLEEMRRMCVAEGVTDEGILASDNLMHAYAGAYMAREVYGVEDAEILSAIARHTLGAADMTPLEVLINLADKIELTRRDYPGLAQVRALAEENLHAALLCSMQGTKRYVESRGQALHPQTLETVKWLETTL